MSLTIQAGPRAQGLFGGLTSLNRGFGETATSATSLTKTIGKLGLGFAALGIATKPFLNIFTDAISKTAQFEFKLSTIQALMGETRKSAIIPLRDEILRLGASTIFTADQVAAASITLSRAGLSQVQQITLLSTVLDTATAANVSLSEAAGIAISVINGFGLPIEKAGDALDTVARAANSSNTSIQLLTSSLILVAPAANIINASLEETSLVIATLAQAGIRGTRAGTALAAAIFKLISPSKKVLELLGGPGGQRALLLEIGKDGKQVFKSLTTIMLDFAGKMDKVTDPLERAKLQIDVFGRRGVRAFNAIVQLGKNFTTITEENVAGIIKLAKAAGFKNVLPEDLIGKQISGINRIRLSLKGAEGSLKKFAKVQLENMLGGFLLVTSAIERMKLALGSLVVKSFANILSDIVAGAQLLAKGFDLAALESEDLTKAIAKLTKGDKAFESTLINIIQLINGFIAGIKAVAFVIKTVVGVFITLGKIMNLVLGDTATGFIIGGLLATLAALSLFGLAAAGVSIILFGLGTIGFGTMLTAIGAFLIKIPLAALMFLVLNGAILRTNIASLKLAFTWKSMLISVGIATGLFFALRTTTARLVGVLVLAALAGAAFTLSLSPFIIGVLAASAVLLALLTLVNAFTGGSLDLPKIPNFSTGEAPAIGGSSGGFGGLGPQSSLGAIPPKQLPITVTPLNIPNPILAANSGRVEPMTINLVTNLDGEQIAISQAKISLENSQRLGFGSSLTANAPIIKRLGPLANPANGIANNRQTDIG